MVLTVLLSISVGALAGCSAVTVFNRLPARWLCDYNETPGDELLLRCQRVKNLPWKAVFSAVLFFAFFQLTFQGLLYALLTLFVLWLLLVISMADKKYMIIPDQFVVLLVLSAFGFLPYHGSLLQPVLGALLGGGCMLLIGIFGKLLYKAEAIGFGDVKLFAAIGLITGPIGVSMILIISSFLSCAVFSIKLILKKITSRDVQPLGPYIALAYFFHELFSPTI